MFSCALYCKVDLCSCWSKMRWCRCSKQDRRQCHRGAEAAEHSPPSACDALYCLLQSYMLRCLANRTLLPLKCASGSFLMLPPSIHTLQSGFGLTLETLYYIAIKFIVGWLADILVMDISDELSSGGEIMIIHPFYLLQVRSQSNPFHNWISFRPSAHKSNLKSSHCKITPWNNSQRKVQQNNVFPQLHASQQCEATVPYSFLDLKALIEYQQQQQKYSNFAQIPETVPAASTLKLEWARLAGH